MEYDVLIEWALPLIIEGTQVVELGLATPGEVCEDLQAAKRQPIVGPEAI